MEYGGMSEPARALVWFRRDLRVRDHAALYHALKTHRQVWCCFVFDSEILDVLEDRRDRRVEFIRAGLVELEHELANAGGGLIVRCGRARDLLPAIAVELGVSAVYANRDYEPAAIDRDREVAERLHGAGVAFRDFKDQVIFERDEVLTAQGRPYSVFTPYKNAWLRRLGPYFVRPYPVEKYFANLAAPERRTGVPEIEQIGFESGALAGVGLPSGMSGARALIDAFSERIDDYHLRRDFPALDGPSRLSAHLRFGTISIRELVALAWQRAALLGSAGAQVWLNELIWRDFYHMILAWQPHVAGHAFRRELDAIAYDERPDWFEAWCQGLTGYPIVDAAMRQLNQTGYMHNRLRMLSASFLVKDLGVDWRLGERYFARKLNDYDLAANNGGWQWAASTGCDAQPYFRIFNPVTQSRKFDPEGEFIRRYVPELRGLNGESIHQPWSMDAETRQAWGGTLGRDYPLPLVEHAAARRRTLARYDRIKRG
jgi:deoxyribodipyrimidine photo-lyase